VTTVIREELIRRFEGNPLLDAARWPYTVNAVFNPGVAQLDGETLLLARVEDRTGISHFAVARSPNGLTDWTVDGNGRLPPDLESETEEFGIEDARITQVDEDYLIVYTGYSGHGPLVCLATTRDFQSYERRGVIMPPEDKDAALFPRRFDGRWALIHRPVSATPRHAAHIWLSWSPDLRHWGDHAILLRAREGAWWDAHKVGLCAPPLETPEGWLLLYHGVRTTAAGSIYRLGLALLDAEHPDRVIARSSEWIFGPDAPYERIGDVDQVVFSCGWRLLDDGDTLRIYYGAADTSICVATASLAALLRWLGRHSS
jgi:beta-1,4-mannooligosaccharide/beta-1,4-mannosyl-N-acetylglucosamine phosphorylase